MLCLTRKENEAVVLLLPGGDEITVTVIEIDRNKIRLGFQAPDSVKIWRQEIMPDDGVKQS